VLLSLDGVALDGPGDLAAALAETPAGAATRVGLARGGRETERVVAPRAGWEEARAA
jgi:S1-C subfamily serine protease